MTKKFILYSDFNCPFCYAMHELLHRKGLENSINWKGVQHAEKLPVPMETDNEQMHSELKSEIVHVKARSPGIVINMPEGKPNTSTPIQYVLSSGTGDHNQFMKSVLSIYQLYWVENLDISNIEVLESTLNLESRLESNIVHQQIATWQSEWMALRMPVVPYLIAENGKHLAGLPDEDIILEFLRG